MLLDVISLLYHTRRLVSQVTAYTAVAWGQLTINHKRGGQECHTYIFDHF